MKHEILEIELRLRERIDQVAREMYSRTAKLDSDLGRLSYEVGARDWHARIEICTLCLMIVPALFLIFLAILLA